MNEPVIPSDAGQAQAEPPTESPAKHPRVPPPLRTAADVFAARLAYLDQVALLIGWGLPLLGLLGAVRLLLAPADSGATPGGGSLSGFLGAICLIGFSTLAGLAVSSLLRVLVQWFSLVRQPREAESPSIERTLADRIDKLSGLLAEPRGPSPLPAYGLDTRSANERKEQSLAEIRGRLRAGKWDEAATMLDELSLDELADSRLSALRSELQSAREAALSEQLAQLNAARQVNDPDRVLELHQSLNPLLDSEARIALDTELSRWFLRLIHNRLRSGKIQTDLAVLACRIAEAFSHTMEGASLRASLPTLRRSAGLCPRCGQPYTGIANACPACLAQALATARPPDPPHDGPAGVS